MMKSVMENKILEDERGKGRDCGLRRTTESSQREGHLSKHSGASSTLSVYGEKPQTYLGKELSQVRGE